MRPKPGRELVVRERTGYPRTDRAFGTGEWDGGEERVVPIAAGRKLVRSFPDHWQDITRKKPLPVPCETPECTYNAYPVGDRRHCRMCHLKNWKAVAAINRAAGLCGCGRPLPEGYRNCGYCRENAARRQRRCRARKRRERKAA